MELIRAHITNFRSAENSDEFRVDYVTCLVGKNEAGKSTILAALAALNPHPATPMVFDKERDYPRRFLTEYASRHPKGEAVTIKTTWELTDDEVAEVEDELGKGVLKSREVQISRTYGAKAPSWEVPRISTRRLRTCLSSSSWELQSGRRSRLPGLQTNWLKFSASLKAQPTSRKHFWKSSSRLAGGAAWPHPA